MSLRMKFHSIRMLYVQSIIALTSLPAAAILSILVPESERRAVDAVPHPGGSRAVVEDVSEMGPAPGASHLSPHHPVGDVPVLGHVLIRGGRAEARPTRTGVELGLGGEEGAVAADAVIRA